MLPSSPATFTDASDRVAWFLRACELVGGKRTMAGLLDMNERSLRFILSGDRPLTDVLLADATAVLRAHADACQDHLALLPP